MSLLSVLPFVLDFLHRKPIKIEVSRVQLTGDAGLLPIRQFDEAIRLTQRFADALADARTGDVRHSNLSLTRQRIYGILADYEDQNDHDALRSDPAFKLVCDRPPDGRDLAVCGRIPPDLAGGAGLAEHLLTASPVALPRTRHHHSTPPGRGAFCAPPGADHR